MSLSQKVSKGHNNKVYAEDSAAHEWYRFVLSYPPHLVRDYIQHFGIDRDGCVLDPFCGTGTTVVEAKKLGIVGVGLEAAPMAHFASSVKVDWSPDPDELLANNIAIADGALHRLHAVKTREVDADAFRNSKPAKRLRKLPEDANNLLLTDSISPLPLHKTLILLQAINELGDPRFRNHHYLALAKSLVNDISNLHFGPEVGVKKPKFDGPVVAPWLENSARMVNDLRELQSLSTFPAQVHHRDSRSMAEVLSSKSVDLVVTSPPYPNEKDYTRTTRLESVILGFLKTKKDLQMLKRTLMRSNTRTIYKGDADDLAVAGIASIQKVANDIEDRRIELKKTSGFERLYANVTRQYFGGMARHLDELKGALRHGAHLVYVVGDQASFFQVMIRTGQLLGEVAESVGYKVKEIQLFRSRLSTATKQYLREEALILEWQGDKKTISLSQSLRNMSLDPEKDATGKSNRYVQLIEQVFLDSYQPGAQEVSFAREDIEKVASKLRINLPKNIGDIIYSFRYRVALPEVIASKAPKGKHWIIRPSGRAKYTFSLASEQRITPTQNLIVTKLPDATPGIVTMYALSDEQALLAKVRYNRIIDIFSGVTCYSIQNHLRTFVAGVGQLETDELYIGIDKRGAHYVFPIQAKGGKDKLSIVQIEQDFALCASKFPDLICRPIAAQFITPDQIALFEFQIDPIDGVRIASERHYELVDPSSVTPELLKAYADSFGN